MSKPRHILKRRPIPALPKGEVRIGKEGLVKRSFDVYTGNPRRVFLGEMLTLSLEFVNPSPAALVVCYTNFQSKDKAWEDLPFKKRKAGVFEFSARAERCGVFGFRIRYSFDGGKTWNWDRAPVIHVHVDPLSMRDLRCYTLIPTVSGTTEQWVTHLEHASEMGFNMVHLLPVTQMGASESPYSATNLFALDPSFYTANIHHSSSDGMDAFEQFVLEARQRKMSLCIDLVLNHVGPDSQIAKSAPEWIMPDKSEPDGLQRSGCWHMDQWLKWEDLVKIYYDNPNEEKKRAVWEYMRDYALFWGYYADVTGGMVRLDNLHNSDEDFIEYILTELRTAYPNLIIHAEFFSDANTVLKRARQWDLNLFLGNSWEYPYAENLREYLKHCHEIGSRVPHYMPATTHDTGAPTQMFGSPGAIVPRYFVTALMTSGQTGLVQGVEYGVPQKVGFIGRNQSFPYAKDNSIVWHITRINSVLKGHDCLHGIGNIHFVDNGHGAIVAAYREGHDVAYVGILLLANFDTIHPHKIELDIAAVTGHPSNYLQDIFYEAAPFRVEKQCMLELPPLGVAAFRVLIWD